GPPRCEKARLAGERLRLVCHGVADVARDRSGQHDSQGQSAVGGEERCHGSSGFHRRAVWHRCLTPSLGKTPHLVSSPARPNLRNETPGSAEGAAAGGGALIGGSCRPWALIPD